MKKQSIIIKCPISTPQEVRELQRQLDHSMKLEEFLRTKGTVRLTAADAKAEAKKLEQQEEEMRIYNNYVNILDALKVRETASKQVKGILTLTDITQRILWYNVTTFHQLSCNR